jgi:hypothetical protein
VVAKEDKAAAAVVDEPGDGWRAEERARDAGGRAGGDDGDKVGAEERVVQEDTNDGGTNDTAEEARVGDDAAPVLAHQGGTDEALRLEVAEDPAEHVVGQKRRHANRSKVKSLGNSEAVTMAIRDFLI